MVKLPSFSSPVKIICNFSTSKMLCYGHSLILFPRSLAENDLVKIKSLCSNWLVQNPAGNQIVYLNLVAKLRVSLL